MSRTRLALFLASAALCPVVAGGCFLDDGCPDEAPAPVQIAETDLDRDGVEGASDCDDRNAALHPGARDIPDDGVDQDCNGADATERDENTACIRARPALFGANPGDTARSIAALQPTCGEPATGSVVYLLTSEVPARVTLTVESAQPHTVHTRVACLSPTELGCQDAGGAPLLFDVAPDAPLHVVVSATAEPGPFVLRASRVSLVP